MHSVKANDAGIFTVSLDGVDVFSADCYAASIIFDQFFSDTVVVSDSGLKPLRLRANGQNVSSGGVYHYITELCCRRIA